MADPAPTPPPADPPTVEIEPAQQAAFNTMFETAVGEYVKKNAPAPTKTGGRPDGFIDWLFNSGNGK